MRTTLLSLVFLSLTVASALAEVEPLTRTELEGRWVGEYQFGPTSTFILLAFGTENDRWGGTYNRPAIDWEEVRELRSITVNPDSLNFQLGGDAISPFVDENPSLVFQLELKDDELMGSVMDGRNRGSVRLSHLASLEKDYLDTLAGDYRLSDGSLLIFERENRYLCFLERSTGRTGRLMPRSKTEFWSGPSLDIWYPAEWQFRFRSADGEPMVEVRRPGAEPVTATRVRLYDQEDVTFQNGAVRLSGTLRLPRSTKPVPAVVVLHGSNYQTRGGQYGSLAFVADEFARNGFAVLNYDKRGTGKSGGEREDTTELLAGDAAAASRLLRMRKEVDAARIGLWGISQGGMLQPAVAAIVPDLAFFVNVSGASQNGNDQEIQRTELKLRADGFSKADIASAVRLQKLKFRYACKRDNWDEYLAAVNAARKQKWFFDPYIGPPDSKESTAWDFWRCGGEGAQGFKRLQAPLLYLYGEHEAYSRSDLNIKALRHSLGRSPKLTIREFKGTEHSMMTATNGGEKELIYLNQYAPEYFDFLISWCRTAVR
jgi:dienelactone hydrolase